MENDLISKYRSEVIERFINLEWLINAIISQHYFNNVYLQFMLEVLYDENFPFSLRKNILVKICPSFDKKILQKIYRLNTIRNYFSHCNQEIIELNNPTEGKVIDPRNLNCSIDFEMLYQEFMSEIGEIEEYLSSIYKSKGGIITSDINDYVKRV